jgi:hypothetical protein
LKKGEKRWKKTKMEQITENNKEKDAVSNRRASLLSIILTSMSYKNIYR